MPDFVGDLCKAIASRVRGAVAGVKFDDFHKVSIFSLRTKTYQKANLPHKTVENRSGLGVSLEFLLFFVDLSQAFDHVTVISS